MTRSKDITSITEHRSNLRDHLVQVNRTGRPMFVTTDGETVAVVLSPSAYDDLARDAQLARDVSVIRRAKSEIEAGKGKDIDAAFDSIRSELLSMKAATGRKVKDR